MENWNQIELESAKSSLIFEEVERETTVAEAVASAEVRILRGVDVDYRKDFLAKIMAVTQEDLKRVGKKYDEIGDCW